MVRYYHPYGVLKEDKILCAFCLAELDEKLLGNVPCSVSGLANRLQLGHYAFEISVKNCKAELLVFTEDEKGKRRYHSLEGSADIMEELEKLVLDSIHKSGGAINISGLYPLSEKLVSFLINSLESGKLRIVES